MPTFANPTFTSDFQGLCNYIATTLNRQDLTTDIPNFVALATTRIQRDMARIKHPFSINRKQASVVNNYSPLPSDFLSIYQLSDQDTGRALVYITPDQSMTIQSQGWGSGVVATLAADAATGGTTFYTIIGNRIRLVPAPGAASPTTLDLWYLQTLAALTTTSTTNWVLTRYPDLYLYGALIHSAPYLKNDERIALWDGLYAKILNDVEVEADRATRPQSKLVAARKGF